MGKNFGYNNCWKNRNAYDERYAKNGVLNKTEHPDFVFLCKQSQKTLKEYLLGLMRGYYSKDAIKCPNKDSEYIYCKGNMPIMLTAHLDTVHTKPVKNYYEGTDKNGKHWISSPQGIGGDDRCGIWIIIKVLEALYKTGKRPYVLFCEDEETGGNGSFRFSYDYWAKLEEIDIKYIIELDRANAKDAVFYDCDNEDFTNYVIKTTGYKLGEGTFSDICNICPDMGVAGVNLSCGYYNAHTVNEYVCYEEMESTKDTVLKLIEDLDNANHFKYIEKRRKSSSSYCYNRFEDEEKELYYLVVTYEKDGKEEQAIVEETNIDRCWRFLFERNPDLSYGMIKDTDTWRVF